MLVILKLRLDGASRRICGCISGCTLAAIQSLGNAEPNVELV